MSTTCTHRKHILGALLVGATLLGIGELTDTTPLMLGGGHAHAVIGRPLTPMSYAGVARRTTRRAVYAGGYAGAGYGYGYGYAAPPVVATTSVVTALPSGCTRVISGGTAQYACGTASYQPYYNGPTVVYQPM